MITIWAAGSLALPLRWLTGGRDGVALRFGPSGLLRQEIEAGARPGLFLSAAREHVEALAEAGLARDARPFCRNGMALLAGPHAAAAATAEAALADPALRLAVSRPGADPSGDYAQSVFDRIERLRPGQGEALRARALILAGGPPAPEPPPGRHPYAWIMERDLTDLFLTYRSNAVQACRLQPGLRLLALPPELAVAAEFWLCTIAAPPAEAAQWLALLTGPDFRAILQDEGFPA